MVVELRHTWWPFCWVVNFFTCCHAPAVPKSPWRMDQTFFESVKEAGMKGPLVLRISESWV